MPPRALLITILVNMWGIQACPAAEIFNLNSDNTTVGFSVSYLVLTNVTGHFKDYDGSFVIDNQHPENSRADLIIKTASVDTGDTDRNIEIRGKSLFDVKNYPTMTFHSRSIEMFSDVVGQIKGDLTLLGITKPVILDFTKIQNVAIAKSNSVADGFNIIGTIKRSDFGMNAFDWAIGNTVTLYACYNIAVCNSDTAKKIKAGFQYD